MSYTAFTRKLDFGLKKFQKAQKTIFRKIQKSSFLFELEWDLNLKFQVDSSKNSAKSQPWNTLAALVSLIYMVSLARVIVSLINGKVLRNRSVYINKQNHKNSVLQRLLNTAEIIKQNMEIHHFFGTEGVIRKKLKDACKRLGVGY